MEDFVPAKPPMNFYGIVYEDFDHDYPDYLHYNYPYFCAYDITSYEETNALDARKYYIKRKKKKGTPIRKGKEVGLNLLLTTTSEGCDSVILVAWPMVILWFFVYKQ